MKPPFTYFGGKTRIAEQIAALLPPHGHYVEPFAGSLAVLLAKRRAQAETVNDLSGDLVNFWRVLRDQPDDLERVCALTPHSREEHQLCYEVAEGELERARRTWVRLTQGRAGQIRQRTGWRFREAPEAHSMPAYLASYVSRLHPAARRLASVSIECRPAVEVIAAYGRHPDTLIYADPPYLDSTRTNALHGDVYVHEMRGEDSHRELAETLRAVKAVAIVSGYDSPLYAELFDGWHRTDMTATCGNSPDTQTRTEVLWSNRPFPQGSLFDLDDQESA
jgi:DNA adenine methylase